MERKILIIDDDRRNTFALSAVLKSRGFQTLVAANMDAAVSLLRQDGSVDLILLDMMMPGMDGYQGTILLKSDEAFSKIPLIAVTAQAMPGDREKCLEAGADGYISKPVDLDLLSALIQKYM